MSGLEEQIVEKLDEGWARWKIADDLGLGESTVPRRDQTNVRALPVLTT